MKNFWERLQSSFSAFDMKGIAKGARITYGVVWNLLLLLVILLVIGGVFAGGVGAGYFASLVKDEKARPADRMKKDIYQYEETSKLFFADNKYLGKLRTDLEREEVKIDQVSDYVKKAIVATEDEYFFEHKGVVPKALLRAVYQEFSNSSVQSGGSTLTQQLIKNQILTNEVSFDRKAKEVLLALRLEKILEKDQILEAYLNVSTFGRNSSGRNIGGIQAAAQGIFGVDAKDLNLPQSAFIAGLPQSPSRYTPFTNTGELKEPKLLEPGLNRMKTVLFRMHREGQITNKEYEDALSYDIKADFIPPLPPVYEKYPWLTYEIEDRAKSVLAEILADKDGISKEELANDDKLAGKYLTLADRDMRQNGYNIHTTVNKDIYDVMQETKDAYQNYGITKKVETTDTETGEKKIVDAPVQIGAILIENKTGKILSFVGGRDFQLINVNHATKAKRSNGSTMKPLLVYAPAMELGKLAGPGVPVADFPLEVDNGGKKHVFQNAGKKYYGLVSARYALAHSYNVAAVSTFMSMADKDPAQFLEKMGISSLTDGDRVYPSTAIGGLTNGVTVEENTNAFATFANGGQFVDAYMIEKITDHSGNVVYEHSPEPVDVFSPQTSYMMIDMMRDVMKYGTARALPGMLNFSADWAGKTGTTNDAHDSWLIASNPNVTFGTWLGYDQPSSLYIRNNSESLRNYRIWANLMNAAHEAAPDVINPNERFTMPGGIVNRSYCAVSGLLPSEACSSAGLIQTDIFNAKFVPTKADDSLISGRYVVAGGKRYLALPSTPAEFSLPGMLLDPDFVSGITLGRLKDPADLIPDNPRWGNILVADAKLEDDGVSPSGVHAAISNDTITWTESGSHDVIGYRVYSSAGHQVASIGAGSTLSYRSGGGQFYVVAVDVAGRESAPSNPVGSMIVIPDPPTPPGDSGNSNGDNGDADSPANGNGNNGNGPGNNNGNGGNGNPPGNNGNGNGGNNETPPGRDENNNP